MQFRMGLVMGLVVGYVFGAKAGRARYEQIAKMWGQVKGSPAAQEFGEDVKVAASKATDTIEGKANEGVAKVTEMVRGEGEPRRA